MDISSDTPVHGRYITDEPKADDTKPIIANTPHENTEPGALQYGTLKITTETPASVITNNVENDVKDVSAVTHAPHSNIEYHGSIITNPPIVDEIEIPHSDTRHKTNGFEVPVHGRYITDDNEPKADDTKPIIANTPHENTEPGALQYDTLKITTETPASVITNNVENDAKDASTVTHAPHSNIEYHGSIITTNPPIVDKIEMPHSGAHHKTMPDQESQERSQEGACVSLKNSSHESDVNSPRESNVDLKQERIDASDFSNVNIKYDSSNSANYSGHEKVNTLTNAENGVGGSNEKLSSLHQKAGLDSNQRTHGVVLREITKNDTDSSGTIMLHDIEGKHATHTNCDISNLKDESNLKEGSNLIHANLGAVGGFYGSKVSVSNKRPTNHLLDHLFIHKKRSPKKQVALQSYTKTSPKLKKKPLRKALDISEWIPPTNPMTLSGDTEKGPPTDEIQHTNGKLDPQTNIVGELKIQSQANNQVSCTIGGSSNLVDSSEHVQPSNVKDTIIVDWGGTVNSQDIVATCNNQSSHTTICKHTLESPGSNENLSDMEDVISEENSQVKINTPPNSPSSHDQDCFDEPKNTKHDEEEPRDFHVESPWFGTNLDVDINSLGGITDDNMSSFSELFPNPSEINMKGVKTAELHKELNIYAAITRVLNQSVYEITDVIRSSVAQSKKMALMSHVTAPDVKEILSSDEVRLPNLIHMKITDMQPREKQVFLAIKNYCIFKYITANYPFLLMIIAHKLKDLLVIVKFKNKYWNIFGDITNKKCIICFDDCFIVNSDI